jgi:hypothetical protein
VTDRNSGLQPPNSTAKSARTIGTSLKRRNFGINSDYQMRPPAAIICAGGVSQGPAMHLS